MLAQFAAQTLPRRHVDGGERFIEQQQARLGSECACESDTLGLTTRKLAWAHFGAIGETNPREPRAGLGASFALRTAARTQPVRDVVEHGQMREQQMVLEQEADAPPFWRHERALWTAVEQFVAETDETTIDVQQARDGQQATGLASTVRANERQGFPRCDLEVDVERQRAARQRELQIEAHR
jgi:hypothetical protein